MSGAGGAGGAGGADGGRGGSRGGGADGAGRGGNAGGANASNDSPSSAASASASSPSASKAASASSIGAAAASMQAAVSAVAAAVKSLVDKAINSLAPAGAFANSPLGQLASMLGMPASVVQSRVMDVAYTAMAAFSPAFALANGLAMAGQTTVAGALSAGVAKLAEQHGMPGFAAKALANVAAQQLAASVPAMGVDVARAVRANMGAALNKASENMGLDFARQVAARVESAVPGATSGQTRAGASVWRDALDASAQQVFGKSTSYLSHAMPALYGNEGLGALSKALSQGSPAPATPEQSLALRDPNAYIEQELGNYVIQLRQQMQQALA